MKNYRFLIRERVAADARFVLALSAWAIAALIAILLITAYTIRLDIAFMEANQMIRDERLRDAIFQQAFDLETWLYFAFPLGIIGNSVIAFLFARTQDKYFSKFRAAFENFGKSWVRPDLSALGPLDKFTRDFMLLAQGRLHSGEPAEYAKRRTQILDAWPKTTRIYWKDQVRFGVLSGFLACYFSSLCMIVFWQANGRILDLSRQLTTTTNGDAPQFFVTQTNMAEPFGWSVVVGITLLSVLSGIRFASTTSNAAYACGRQLKRFLEGNTSARIVLRLGDPGREEMDRVNEVLSRLAEEMAGTEAAKKVK